MDVKKNYNSEKKIQSFISLHMEGLPTHTIGSKSNKEKMDTIDCINITFMCRQRGNEQNEET